MSPRTFSLNLVRARIEHSAHFGPSLARPRRCSSVPIAETRVQRPPVIPALAFYEMLSVTASTRASSSSSSHSGQAVTGRSPLPGVSCVGPCVPCAAIFGDGDGVSAVVHTGGVEESAEVVDFVRGEPG